PSQALTSEAVERSLRNQRGRAPTTRRSPRQYHVTTDGESLPVVRHHLRPRTCASYCFTHSSRAVPAIVPSTTHARSANMTLHVEQGTKRAADTGRTRHADGQSDAMLLASGR